MSSAAKPVSRMTLEVPGTPLIHLRLNGLGGDQEIPPLALDRTDLSPLQWALRPGTAGTGERTVGIPISLRSLMQYQILEGKAGSGGPAQAEATLFNPSSPRQGMREAFFGYRLPEGHRDRELKDADMAVRSLQTLFAYGKEVWGLNAVAARVAVNDAAGRQIAEQPGCRDVGVPFAEQPVLRGDTASPRMLTIWSRQL